MLSVSFRVPVRVTGKVACLRPTTLWPGNEGVLRTWTMEDEAIYSSLNDNCDSSGNQSFRSAPQSRGEIRPAQSAWRDPARSVGVARSGPLSRRGEIRPAQSAWRDPARSVGVARSGPLSRRGEIGGSASVGVAQLSGRSSAWRDPARSIGVARSGPLSRRGEIRPAQSAWRDPARSVGFDINK
ncbi:hypothetical protein JTE90_015853 [Oedothorax gibbosus]|uniref:Uncharacterized protein n=1 Tax=Oedothorax gibbosus TaxID=931172 RepID=A0AAV6VT31_9ARAC|nr:hypothetical protein JTE90_015853 [Oedothorax gibbosus]